MPFSSSTLYHRGADSSRLHVLGSCVNRLPTRGRLARWKERKGQGIFCLSSLTGDIPGQQLHLLHDSSSCWIVTLLPASFRCPQPLGSYNIASSLCLSILRMIVTSCCCCCCCLAYLIFPHLALSSSSHLYDQIPGISFSVVNS